MRRSTAILPLWKRIKDHHRLIRLFKRKGDTVFIVGIATDFCVAWTAIDACKLGFKAYVISDATKGIDLDGSLQHAWQDMLAAGVKRLYVKDVIQQFQAS